MRHSENAELACSLLTVLYLFASFLLSGFIYVCTLHISKSSTSLWTALSCAHKITTKAWSAKVGKYFSSKWRGEKRRLYGPCPVHSKQDGYFRVVKATIHYSLLLQGWGPTMSIPSWHTKSPHVVSKSIPAWIDLAACVNNRKVKLESIDGFIEFLKLKCFSSFHCKDTHLWF